MYESFFHFSARPFLSTPVAERYFPASAAEHARETATRCVERAEGPAVILGAAGTGKSTVCQVIAQQMADKFRVVMLSSAQLCTRRALLQHILFELKLPYRDRDEGELRLSLMDALEPSGTCPHGMLLIVDEAHVLPLRLLEEIRMITNLVRQGQPRVRLVLAASLVFDERMAAPRMDSFNQRLAARCYLQSMNRDETSGYIRAQIAAVEGQPDKILTPDALQAVYRATDGIPRLVNQVCDHVLLLAAANRRAPITAHGVEEAWSDLQQLPGPWTRGTANAAPTRDILEFGQLDDAHCGELDAGDLVVAADSVAPEDSRELPADETVVPPALHQEPLNDSTSAVAATCDACVPSDPFDCPESARTSQDSAIELTLHCARDPFAERFVEEELVVDPVALLAYTPVGPSDLGAESADERPHTSISAARVDETPEPWAPLDETDSDPVLPEVVEAVATTPLARPSVTADMPPGDDRDLLEIVDDSPEIPEDYALAIAAYRPRRRAYRRLFASLRGR